MDRAADVVNKILSNQLQWKDLFSKHTFFTNAYKYYLSVVAASRSKDAQLTWSGLVESKVRLLVASLEHVESIELAHPFIKGFDRVHRCRTEEEVEMIANGNVQFQTKDVLTESTDLSNDQKKDGASQVVVNGDLSEKDDSIAKTEIDTQHVVYTTTYYVGIEIVQGGLEHFDFGYIY